MKRYTKWASKKGALHSKRNNEMLWITATLRCQQGGEPKVYLSSAAKGYKPAHLEQTHGAYSEHTCLDTWMLEVTCTGVSWCFGVRSSDSQSDWKLVSFPFLILPQDLLHCCNIIFWYLEKLFILWRARGKTVQGEETSFVRRMRGTGKKWGKYVLCKQGWYQSHLGKHSRKQRKTLAELTLRRSHQQNARNRGTWFQKIIAKR